MELETVKLRAAKGKMVALRGWGRGGPKDVKEMSRKSIYNMMTALIGA